MTEPRILTDAELLTWALVTARRGQQQRDGITILLLPYPPCPTCGEPVHKQDNITVERGSQHETRLTLRPCGHTFVAREGQFDRIGRHYLDMLGDLDDDWRGRRQPGGWLPEHWTTADIACEAQTRTCGDLSGPVKTATEATEERR